MAQTFNPSIAQSSPTNPRSHYSPYPPQHGMQPQYIGQPMVYERSDWAGQYQQSPYPHSPATTSGAPLGMVLHTGGHPPSTLYSFVPTPNAQQHKRSRRRYEKIERIYKCGWNGCEKSYGTLNHLNAHVTMQGHGQKRTPEEFKVIRKELKAKKKEEEKQCKQDEERAHQDAARNGQDGRAQDIPGQYAQPNMVPRQTGEPQLPSIGYRPSRHALVQYQPQQVGGAQQYAGGSQMYSGQVYSQSLYAQGGMPYQHQQQPAQVYQQQQQKYTVGFIYQAGGLRTR